MKGWTLTVDDAKLVAAKGYMTKDGADNASKQLFNAIQVGYTAPIAGTDVGTIATYQTALQNVANGYGKIVGPSDYSIPLYANQTVVVGKDAAGTYSITLTYICTPGTP